jgi:hypothetical protein
MITGAELRDGRLEVTWRLDGQTVTRASLSLAAGESCALATLQKRARGYALPAWLLTKVRHTFATHAPKRRARPYRVLTATLADRVRA